MPQTFANTINSNPIYADRAEKDAAGNTISTTYATKAELPTVPVTDVEVDGASVVNQGVAEITMPTVDQTYDSASSNAQSGVAMAGALANKQDTISAGNGIDITNNVVSADLDGTSLTNGANGLSVTLPVPDTTGASQGDVLSVGQNGIEWATPSSGGGESKFFAEAMYKSFDDSLHSLVPGMAIDYNKAYSQTLNAIVLEFSYYNNVPVFGRTRAKHLSKFADSDREIVLVSNQSQDSVDAYPVWLPCTSNRDGYLTPVSTGIYLKYKNTVRFSQSPITVNAYIADGTRSQWSLRRAATVKVPMTYGLGFDDTIFEQVGDWSSITEAPVEKWVLAFRDSSNTNWITLNASTSEAYSGFCVRFPYNIFDVKVWSGNGLDINPYNGLYVTNPLPSSTSSDENKVLTVNSSGTPEWATPSGGGSVTDVEVNGSSVVNASGVAEVTVPAQVNADWNSSSGASEILNKPTIPSGVELVPAATSADADKVLTVDGQGIPGWAVVPPVSTGLFEAVYGQTSYSDITQAISDKKIVYCRISATGASRMAFLAYIGSSNVEFQYYRSLNSHSASNMTDEVYVYTVASSGWTTTTRKTGVKVVAGTHMSQSYSNDTLTLNATWPTIDQTYDASSANAQSGIAVAQAIATKEDAFDVGTGLEMDTSGATPTLQVEAPVDIVAGPGIVIDNPDGNTLRVSQATPSDETVLWSNTSGVQLSSGTTVTLSEVTTNFDRILAYHGNNDMAWSVVNTFPGLANRMELVRYSYDGAAYIIQDGQDLTTTDNKVFSASRNIRRLQFNTNGSFSLSTNQNTTFKLFKVVGVHRIANN